MTSPKHYEGSYLVSGEGRVAIVASRFNHFVVDKLVDGALEGLARHGVSADRVAVAHVPGSWELPLVAQRLARGGRFRAVLALGAVIRGATPHFEHVAAQAATGVARAMMDTGVPVLFGVLTTDTIEQAVERAGTKAGNKGFDAAMAALEMMSLDEALSTDGL